MTFQLKLEDYLVLEIVVVCRNRKAVPNRNGSRVFPVQHNLEDSIHPRIGIDKEAFTG